MKKQDLIVVGVGAVGIAAAGFYFLKKNNAASASQAAGSESAGYTSDAYSNWASQQKAPVVNIEPIGIFKTAVDDAMTFVKNLIEPRGIRNNNPLNLRWYSVNNWDGLTQQAKDSEGYCIFVSPEYGIRAAAKTLDSYARRGLVTIQQIIQTWAPASENNVAAYVSHVCQQMGKAATAKMARANGDFVPLLAAMIKHENGKQPYPLELIKRGVSMI